MLSKTKHHLVTGSRYPREKQRTRSMARANGSTTAGGTAVARLTRQLLYPETLSRVRKNRGRRSTTRNSSQFSSILKSETPRVQSLDELLGTRACLTVADKGHGEYGKPDTRSVLLLARASQPIRSERSRFSPSTEGHQRPAREQDSNE